MLNFNINMGYKSISKNIVYQLTGKKEKRKKEGKKEKNNNSSQSLPHKN